MSITEKIAVAIGVNLVAALLLLQFDDELSSEADAMLTAIDW